MKEDDTFGVSSSKAFDETVAVLEKSKKKQKGKRK